MRAILLLMGLMVVRAIYPDGHFDRSVKLTTSNFEQTVQENIDAGKTFFAPAWNDAVQMFAGHPSVAFGDVNLSENRVMGGIKGSGKPGAGGWPTVRYYNKETGPEGAAYTKKTNDPMCTELGPGKPYMRKLIEEVGGVDPSYGDKKKDEL